MSDLQSQLNETLENVQQKLNSTFDKLKQQRDELNVKLHLAKADVRDEWEQVEHKWQQVEAKMHQVATEAKGASKDVGAALGALQDEIGKAYERIRKQIS